jgi:SulP family sulfate permease
MGFLVSVLGGSRYQIGGPAGAFIVLVAATVAKFGVQGLLLTRVGLSALGSLIRHIPHAVTVTILASQLKDLGGLSSRRLNPVYWSPKW